MSNLLIARAFTTKASRDASGAYEASIMVPSTSAKWDDVAKWAMEWNLDPADAAGAIASHLIINRVQPRLRTALTSGGSLKKGESLDAIIAAAKAGESTSGPPRWEVTLRESLKVAGVTDERADLTVAAQRQARRK